MDPRAPCSDKNHLRQGWLEEPNKICYITVFLRIWKYLFHVLIYKIIAYQVYFSIIELGNWRVTEEQRLEGGWVGLGGPDKMSTVGEVRSTSKGQPPRWRQPPRENTQKKHMVFPPQKEESFPGCHILARFSVKQFHLFSGNLLNCGMWAVSKM